MEVILYPPQDGLQFHHSHQLFTSPTLKRGSPHRGILIFIVCERNFHFIYWQVELGRAKVAVGCPQSYLGHHPSPSPPFTITDYISHPKAAPSQCVLGMAGDNIVGLDLFGFFS